MKRVEDEDGGTILVPETDADYAELERMIHAGEVDDGQSRMTDNPGSVPGE